jgi:hypothetical protein
MAGEHTGRVMLTQRRAIEKAPRLDRKRRGSGARSELPAG